MASFIDNVNSSVGKEICEALGLKDVIGLDISLHLDDAATITVKYFPTENQVRAIIPVLKKYKIIPID